MNLNGITKAVVHTPCMDGLASAMVIQDALPHVEEIVFCCYGKQQLELECEPGMLFCDFTPARERVAEYVTAGAIVLDHHIHARDIVEAFGDNGRFSDEPGVSGAVLACLHLWGPHNPGDSVREFVRLVGIRDTWRKESPDWARALELHAILEAFPREHWLDNPDAISGALDALDRGLGHGLVTRRMVEVAQILKTGLILHKTEPMCRVWALSCVDGVLVSDLAEAARGGGVDVLVNLQLFVQDESPRYRVNLRSNESLDVGALAKRYGGGGHRAAAGFEFHAEKQAEDFFRWLIAEASL